MLSLAGCNLQFGFLKGSDPVLRPAILVLQCSENKLSGSPAYRREYRIEIRNGVWQHHREGTNPDGAGLAENVVLSFHKNGTVSYLAKGKSRRPYRVVLKGNWLTTPDRVELVGGQYSETGQLRRSCKASVTAESQVDSLKLNVDVQKRVALVVGNSAYKHTSELANPRNDAHDVAEVLRKHGFRVIQGVDLDKANFERAIRDFSEILKDADAGLFFYAGHGMQVDGQNYLVPIDAKIVSEAALDWELLRVDVVQRSMERSTNTNILFLDACRDNPLSRNLARAMGTRSSFVGRGLASIESGIGTLISFSTQPGNIAADGTGRNSPFAAALVKQLTSSNEDLSAILIAVRNDVMKESGRKQVPWEHSALTGRFYFGPSGIRRN